MQQLIVINYQHKLHKIFHKQQKDFNNFLKKLFKTKTLTTSIMRLLDKLNRQDKLNKNP
jgi:hypothetical protein